MRMSFRESAAILGISIIIVLSALFGAKAEPHLAILSSLIFVSGYGVYRVFKFEDVEHHMIQGIREAIKPILIMLLVGITIAVWIYFRQIMHSYSRSWLSIYLENNQRKHFFMD
jgi:NhaC family Na+:H+ antiporter